MELCTRAKIRLYYGMVSVDRSVLCLFVSMRIGVMTGFDQEEMRRNVDSDVTVIVDPPAP